MSRWPSRWIAALQLDPTSLVERISEIVDEMKEDGTLEELSAKWYGTNLTVAPRPTS